LTDADGNILIRTESVGEIDVGLGAFFCGQQYVIKLEPPRPTALAYLHDPAELARRQRRADTALVAKVAMSAP